MPCPHQSCSEQTELDLLKHSERCSDAIGNAGRDYNVFHRLDGTPPFSLCRAVGEAPLQALSWPRRPSGRAPGQGLCWSRASNAATSSCVDLWLAAVATAESGPNSDGRWA